MNDQAAHRLQRRNAALVTEYVRELAATGATARRDGGGARALVRRS